jgi:O-antigen/teichoic acid export membrane protein
MLAGLVAIPFLIQHLGQERLGVLSLIWVIVGYFSFLDMGLGRAVTVAVASCRSDPSTRRTDELHIVGTASVLLLAVGCAMVFFMGLGVLGLGIPVRLSSPVFAEEVKLAVLWMLPSLPLLLLSSVLKGGLEGTGEFRALNLLRIPTGVMLVVGPCLAALYSPHLMWACISILLVRLVHFWVLVALVARKMELRSLPFIRTLLRASHMAWLRRLLAFGGWVTVSNVVGPVIVYVDRFVIGAVVAAASVAFYSVPFDVVSRLPILVAALCSVLLPELARLSRGIHREPANSEVIRSLVRRSSKLSAVVVAVLVLVGCLLAPWALRVWLGPTFEVQSTLITQVLLLAFGVNAVAQIPFTALQAAGRVRSVALLHVVELLPYGASLYVAISWLGIEGAAWASLLRSVIDYLVLSWMWRRHTPSSAAAYSV